MNNNADKKDIENNISDYTIIDGKKIRKDIITKKIYPFYIQEIDNYLVQRKMWSYLYSIFSTFTIVLMSASTIVSFSVPQFPKKNYVSYIAGILGVISLMCDRFSHYCNTQGSASTQKINMLLNSIGINDTLPDIMTIKSQDLDSLTNSVNLANPSNPNHINDSKHKINQEL